MHMLGFQEVCLLVVGFFEVMCKVLNVAIEFSNTVGYFIVTFGVVVVKYLINICETVVLISKILYEDGLIFLIDFGNTVLVFTKAITSLFQSFFSILLNIWNSLKNISTSTYQLVTSTCDLFGTRASRAIEAICNIPETLKQIIVIVGNGIWLALKIIPLTVVYVSSMTVFLIGRSCEELSSIARETINGISRTITNVITFATDIPTESLIGLVVGMCVVFLCVKYRYSLASSIVAIIRFSHAQMAQVLHSVWMGLENMILNLVASPNNMPVHENIGDAPPVDISESETDDSTLSEASTADMNNVDEPEPAPTISKRKLRLKLVEEQENKLCVVCQDRGKSIIIFPCRHVCLCSICSDIIKNRQGTCPICRERVRRTMRVYL